MIIKTSEQLKLHKKLLIASVVLVTLSIARLITTFTSGSMKSTDDACV